jgi:seryl-tRNA synthetase
MEVTIENGILVFKPEPELKFDTVVQLDSRKFHADVRRLEQDYETCKFDKKKGKFVGVKSSYRGPKRNKKHRLQQKLANAQQELEAVKEELAQTRTALEKAKEQLYELGEDEHEYCSCGGILTWVEGAVIYPDSRYSARDSMYCFCSKCDYRGQSVQ